MIKIIKLDHKEDYFINKDRYKTFFTMWDSSKGFVTDEALEKAGMQQQAIDLAFLDVILLNYLSFKSDYIDAKIRFMRDCKGEFCDKFLR